MRVGTDICSVNRIAKAYKCFGRRFLDKILTSDETAYVLSHPVHLAGRLAGRFAAKEAASKALGTGWKGISFKEIEVVNEASGAPMLKLHGQAAHKAATMGLTTWQISISHEKEYAVAMVIAYGRDTMFSLGVTQDIQ